MGNLGKIGKMDGLTRISTTDIKISSCPAPTPGTGPFDGRRCGVD